MQVANKQRLSRPAVLMGATAVVLAIAGFGLVQFAVRQDGPDATLASQPASQVSEDCMSNSSFWRALSPTGLLLAVACAQEPTAPPNAMWTSQAAIDARSLSAVRLTYRLSGITDGIVTSEQGMMSLHLEEADYDGKATWRALRVGRSRFSVGSTDTTYLAKETLRPLAHVAYVSTPRAPSRLVLRQQFLGDSVLGHVRFRQARRIALAIPDSVLPLVNEHHLLLLLRSLAIDRAWRGSFTLVPITPSHPFVPVALHVVRAERVSVPAGTFDTWRVQVTLAGHVETWWITRGTHLLVRMQGQTIADYVHQTELVSIDGSR